ncbi:MFS transporter [Photobacterium sp. CCB-ST2H9]|uniref:MFS transporter n=1 Tax=Photobacterium sp. CCB-ST2H9 TaxID=2912855 RepID=UPI0020055D46|nr:MFS transporter [Photobacterium sp. CCB-ST2H9]UTM57051.1 MFS transporter [Photobacterium sp. CCB-ST2H9]
MNTMKQYSRLLLGALLVVLSLSLIWVVGYAQAQKSYQQQSRDAILAQTEAARIGIEQILSSGVPLHEIAGLEKVLAPIAQSDASVVDLRVVSGQQALYRYTTEQMEGSLVSIPLNNKFAQAGVLEILLSNDETEKVIDAHFQPMLLLVALLAGLFVWRVLRSTRPNRYLTAFGLVFAVMSLSVILMVGVLYQSGLQHKADSMANIVTQRLAPVLRLGISPHQVSGMDTMLDSFRQSNPEVSRITVTHNEAMIARSQSPSDMLSAEGMAQFSVADHRGNLVTIAFYPKAILAQLAHILKNFAILFAGCALICFAFVRLLSHAGTQSRSEQVLAKIKPLLLVTVLMEALMAPVLPQYLSEIAVQNGGTASWSSYFFTLYFVGFAAMLLPAARMVDLFDIRRVLNAGIACSAVGCLMLAFDAQLWSVLAARLISGMGQAMIFIAAQGYLLRFSDQSNKTRAAGIIVFCFNAGFISGAAIGALLAESLGVQGIFMLSAAVGVLMFLFALSLPSISHKTGSQKTGSQNTGRQYPGHSATPSHGSLAENLRVMVQDSVALIRVPSFVRTMLLVGIPTKMMLTGVVSFAVPILLSKQGVAKESIGQVLMAYAFAVLFVSGKVSPLIDRMGSAKWALCLGNGVAAVSLVVLASAFSLENTTALVATATAAMLIMGVSHGLINAPVVTHVVSVAGENNANAVASTYRFLERIGHVAGAVVVGALLAQFGQLAAFWSLAAFFALAGLLMWGADRTPTQEATA